MKTILASAMGLAMALAATAQAAPFTLPQTFGPYELTADKALTDAVVRATGAGGGVKGDLVSPPGYDVGDSVLDFLDMDFETEATLADDDFIELYFASQLINGDGFDFVVFEVYNQSDPAGVTLDWMFDDLDDVVRLEATQLTDGANPDGLYLFDVDGDGTIEDDEGVFIYGFDLTDLGLGTDEVLLGSLFLSAGFAGAADIAHISALNIVTEMPEVPLPAAAWLFIAGAAGFGFAGWKKKTA